MSPRRHPVVEPRDTARAPRSQIGPPPVSDDHRPLGSESLPWLHDLARRVAQRRPTMPVDVVGGAGHLVHHDAPERFVELVLT